MNIYLEDTLEISSGRRRSNLNFEGSFVNFGQKLQELYQFKEKIHFQKNAKMHKKVAIKFKRGDWPWPPRYTISFYGDT